MNYLDKSKGIHMENVSIAQAKAMFLESIVLPHSANTQQTYKKALETFLNLLSTNLIDIFSFPVAELREDSILQFI
jgi:hypothetical protein